MNSADSLSRDSRNIPGGGAIFMQLQMDYIYYLFVFLLPKKQAVSVMEDWEAVPDLEHL